MQKAVERAHSRRIDGEFTGGRQGHRRIGLQSRLEGIEVGIADEGQRPDAEQLRVARLCRAPRRSTPRVRAEVAPWLAATKAPAATTRSSSCWIEACSAPEMPSAEVSNDCRALASSLWAMPVAQTSDIRNPAAMTQQATKAHPREPRRTRFVADNTRWATFVSRIVVVFISSGRAAWYHV